LHRITRKEILAMFGFNDVELKQTRFYQAVLTGRRVATADAEFLPVWAERILGAKFLEEEPTGPC